MPNDLTPGAADQTSVAQRGALHGVRVVDLTQFEAGKLVRVLPDWDFGSREVNALFVSGKTIKPAARAFADFLLRELRAS